MQWASASKWHLSAFPKRPRLDVSLHFCLSSQAGCLLCRPPRQQWQEKHESFLLHVTLPNSFASLYPPGIWFTSELPIHSLDDCFLCIYWETGPLWGAEDAVNKTCKRPHLIAAFSPFLCPSSPSVIMGESEDAGSTLQISKCTSPGVTDGIYEFSHPHGLTQVSILSEWGVSIKWFARRGLKPVAGVFWGAWSTVLMRMNTTENRLVGWQHPSTYPGPRRPEG